MGVNIVIFIGILIGLAILIGIASLLLWYLRNQGAKNLQLDIMQIKIPKYTKREKEELTKQYIEETLGKIENLFTALAALKAEKSFFKARQDIFALEVVAKDNLISFYAAVPPKHREFFIQQIQAVYPKVYFEQVSDYNIFQPDSQLAAGYLRFSNDFSLPIKTYRTFENDPLESITNSLSKLGEGEAAAIQYIFRSAPKKWHKRGRKIAQNMYKGMSFKDAASAAGGESVGFLAGVGKVAGFFGSFVKTNNKEKEEKFQPRHDLSMMEQERAKGLEQKTAKPGLEANIRMVVSSNDLGRCQAILKDILNSYTQYNIYEFGNSFHSYIPKNHNQLVQSFIYRQYLAPQRLLLNSEEMVSVVHLPLPTTGTPNILWLDAVKAPPPTNLPSAGIILGKNDYRGRETLIHMKPDDRRRHMYIIGQTGTGKSQLLENLAVQDILAGQGLCVVDPHGDLIEKILGHIPKERVEDVIVFDPSDTQRPLGLNMLEYDSEEQKTFVINEMLAIFDKLYDLRATGGPMFEQYMRNAMMLMMDDPASGATLAEIPRVLSDENYRKYKLSKVRNQYVSDFWIKEAQKAGGEAALANMVPYITSKLTPFISNDLIRPIISQAKSAINFRVAMDQKKIVLVNLSKGKIGDMNSSLLGMIVIGKLLFAALSRINLSEEKREDFYLYIDEFQNFITDSISVILSEARKYKLNLIMAHQFIAQLVKGSDTRIRDAIFGNVGTLVAYRIGVDDAELIAKQLAPVVTEYDLTNMPKYTCYVKLLIDNANPPAFNFNPLAPTKANFELAAAIKEYSRLKYGRDRLQIEEEIRQRTKIL